MALTRLEQLQQKVEQGEPLTDAELTDVQAAARADPTPRWRLVVAHALLNAEENARALPLFEALVRDHPRYPQTKLGLARALISLERFRDAERVLKEVNQEHPQDPEPIKGLAILALRNGEHDRAHALIDEALRLDPFDGEAQLVAAELNAPGELPAPAPGVTIASENGFITALLDELAKENVAHVHRGANLYLKGSSGRMGRVDLHALYDSYVAETRPLEEVVSLIVRQLREAGEGEAFTKEQILERVRAVVRDDAFMDKAEGAASRGMPGGVRLFFVLDDPELIRYLPSTLLEQQGIEVDTIYKTALENLGRHPPELRRVRLDGAQVLPTGATSNLLSLWTGDGYDGARLYLREVQEQLRAALGPGELRVYLGRRELVLVCAASDIDNVKALAALEPQDGVAGEFALAADGSLDRVEPGGET